MDDQSIPTSRAEALACDAQDPLADRRDHFALPDGVIYLDGNSLGPPPKTALSEVQRAASVEWADGLIRSWNDAGWIDLPSGAGARVAPLIGAEPDEVTFCDSVSVNLFKLAAAAISVIDRPNALVVEEDEFPTDQYIAERAAEMLGVLFIRAKSGDGANALADHGGGLIKSIVNYKTAAIADMRATEQAAASAGGAVIWDLSHGAGVLSIDVK
ncbi:MAG: hypothetical protein AAGJ87_14615, partial [Pseudomonadota bacterium]